MFAASARARAAYASNSCGAIGVCSDGSISALLLHHQTVDLLQDPGGDALLPGAGEVALAGGGDDRHLVVAAVKADARLRDVVDDDRVQPLALQLAAPVGDRAVTVLGGKADDELIRALGAGQGTEHVLGRLE